MPRCGGTVREVWCDASTGSGMNLRMNLRRILAIVILSFWALLGVPLPMAAQQTADLIRGRVTSEDGQPIAGVQVTAVSYFGGITKTARTNRDGRYSITYPNGEGDYWLAFAAIGYQGQRIEVKRLADEEVLVADIKLSNTQVLQTVTTTASGPRQVPRSADNAFSSDPSGGDRTISNTSVSPDVAGNLAAMAATMPGCSSFPASMATPIDSPCSGSTPQNNTTLNGQQGSLRAFPATPASLPSFAPAMTSRTAGSAAHRSA